MPIPKNPMSLSLASLSPDAVVIELRDGSLELGEPLTSIGRFTLYLPRPFRRRESVLMDDAAYFFAGN
jgi:hypothetical protein